MYKKFLTLGHKGFLVLEEILNRIFTPRFNPMYYLGAIAFLFTWVVFVSGFYLLFIYGISLDEAYDSMAGLNRFNNLFRSLHRYASDGAMIAIILHLTREYFNDRYRNWRWIAWVTGIGAFLLYWILGVTGYWMVWDQRSQLIARMTAEFLDYIPLFAEPMSRAFLTNGTVTNIVFIGVIFLHLSLPTLTLFILWMHVVRISRPVINPPRATTITFLLIVLGICLIYPAASVSRADLNYVAARFGIDWWYLALYPMLTAYPTWFSWTVTLAGTGLLVFLPWTIKRETKGIARVIQENCTGCELCYKDCPYEAIYMRKRTDGLPYNEEAVVAEKRCASCGLCVGACDFHAVDMPGLTEEMISKEMERLLSFDSKGQPRILNVACGFGVEMKGMIDPATGALAGRPNVRVLILPCVAMLQPAMIERGMKAGADGVFISGCREGDCHFREGDEFVEGRLLNARPPILKKKEIDPARVRAGWFSAIQKDDYLTALDRFVGDVRNGIKGDISLHRKMRERLTVFGVIVLILPAVFSVVLSDLPYTFFGKDQSLLLFSFKHGGKHIRTEPAIPHDELMKLPPHMRARIPKAGPRFPVYVELDVDGKNILSRRYEPGGVKGEGASYAYEKLSIPAGRHRVVVRMSDTGTKESFDYTFDREIELEAGRQICIDFDHARGRLYIRD